MNERREILTELLIAVVLSAVIAAVWLTAMNGWKAEHWSAPLSYQESGVTADTLWLLAGFKAAEEGDLGFFKRITIPRLGAPFGARWDDFPWTEKAVFVFPGIVAGWIGLYPAMNLAVLLAHVLAGVSFYAAARMMNVDRVWSAAGAFVFALSRYAFAHGAHHLNITLFWHVPLCLVVCRWISLGEGLPQRGSRFWIAVGIAFVAGTQNIYYTNIFIQLAALGALVQWIRHGWKNAWPGFVICGVSILAVLLMNVNTLVAWATEGVNTGAVVRYYQWVEFYALKVADLFIPYPDHSAWGDFGRSYIKGVLILGELPPGSYLGLIGIAGLVWLGLETFLRMVKRPETGIPLESVQIGWIVLYSVVGGINGLIGAAGIQLFRATTRYSVVILALALLFLVRRLSPLTRGRDALAAGMVCIMASIAIWDQTAPWTTDEQIEKATRTIASDKAFTEAMESRLPQGAMVFQLPIIDFPERVEGKFSGYENFRPYLYSKHLRFSFGTVKGRPRQDWHNDLKQLGMREAIGTLERYGFAGLFVNLNGFPGHGDEITQTLRQVGRGDVIVSDAGDLVVMLLQPSANPVLPERAPPAQ